MLRCVWLLPICVLSLSAQEQGPPPGGPRPGGPGKAFTEPKNLKVLKTEELRQAMTMARRGLGVRCTYCHVEGDFANDSVDKKAIARTMFQMVEDLNTNTFKTKAFGNEAKVTCFTCHRGAEEPVSMPPAEERGPGGAPGEAPRPQGTPPK